VREDGEGRRDWRKRENVIDEEMRYPDQIERED